MIQRVLCWIFAHAYRRWLETGDRVEKVIGWRTARVVSRYRGSVRWVQPCFWWFR